MSREKPFSRIAGNCSVYSKTLFAWQDGYPQYLSQALDQHAWDEAGRRYTDWWSALGSISLGHSHSSTRQAIQRQINHGINFSLPHRLEGETADVLCDMAGIEQLRWCKNGSDATEAAVRLARKVTGHRAVITTGYHGFHSDLVTATPGKIGGVLEMTKAWTRPVATLQDLHEELTAGNVACVLAEPIFADGTIWPWAAIKEACRKAGALLIFDEVITGFRYCPGSALHDVAHYTKNPDLGPAVVSDLYCFGKSIANGMPLACVAGPRGLMKEYEKNVFFSSTAAAECLSLAVCKATLEVMRDEPVHEHVWKIGQLLIDGAYGLKLNTSGLAPRTQFRFPDDAQRDQFLSGMVKRGHLLGRDNFLTYSHTVNDIDQLLTAAEEVLRELF